MKIQSLSIAVPAPCGNKCVFCVAHMNRGKYTNQIEHNKRFADLYERDYMRRLEFARDNGCNSVMLTGDGEPLLNESFLRFFADCNRRLERPFRQIELQTSGTTLDDEIARFLRNSIDVSTISLSLSGLDDDTHAGYVRPKSDKFRISIKEVTETINKYDFLLRLSLNLMKEFEAFTPEQIFERATAFGARQLTFRVMYDDGSDSEESRAVRNNRASIEFMAEVRRYITEKGRPLNKLPYGATKYSVNGITTVVDEDCMSTAVTEDYKYLILREDCRLYSHWDDKGSILF